MHSHIQKWGNSLGVRIPLQFAKKLNLHAGSEVILDIEGGKLTLQTPKYNLQTMLSEITPKNLHHQILDDSPKGNEEW